MKSLEDDVRASQKLALEYFNRVMGGDLSELPTEAAAMFQASVLLMVTTGCDLDELRTVVTQQLDIYLDRCKEIIPENLQGHVKKDVTLN